MTDAHAATQATTTVRRACQWCEAVCGLTMQVRDNRIVSVEGDPDDPMSQGFLCPKGVATAEVAADPDRLVLPQVRQPDGSFREVDWQTAYDLVGERLRDVRRRHGNDAVATYMGNPAGTTMAPFHLGMLVDVLRTRNQYSAASTDQAPQSLVSWLLFGNQYLFPVPDLDRTDHLLIVGANPLVSNGSLVTAPDWRRRIRAIQGRGGRVVVVDPRRTETARVAREHVAVRPGTDALLLAAMVQTLDAEGLVAPGRLADFTDGLDRLLVAVRDVTPERVADVVGVPAEDIRALARDFAQADRAAAYLRIGPCQTLHGSVAAWLVVALNVVTGNLDRVGGSMFTRPAFDLQRMVGITGRAGSYDAHRSRVRGLPELGGELPIATLADEIETPGEGQVRALLLYAGNITRSAPNGRRLEAAIRTLDFVVAVDPHLNETTRLADVVLPPIAPYEREHYDVIFQTWAVRNVARLSPAAVEPDPRGRTEQEILMELAVRLGVERGQRLQLAALSRLRGLMDTLRILDLGLLAGPWGLRRGPRRALTVKRLRAAGGTVDLGPLTPELPKRLFTDDGRLHLAPDLLVDALDAAVADLLDGPTTGPDELTLIGRRHLRSKNSWMHNTELLAKGRDRCTVLLHPDDAAARGLVDGDLADVTSRVGTIRVPVEVDEAMRPGVASIPHGWGHDVEGVRLGVASAHPGASVNDVTDDRVLERLTGNAAFNAVPVTVTASSAGGAAVTLPDEATTGA